MRLETVIAAGWKPARRDRAGHDPQEFLRRVPGVEHPE
jgi:hypothetical protein